jgi:hypothetical protein
MSKIAKSGFRAETLFCSLPSVKAALEGLFQIGIKSIKPAPSRKKTDIIVVFDDNTSVNIQNKNGENARGFSIDRRRVGLITAVPECETLLRNVCLKEGVVRPTVGVKESRCILKKAVLGEESLYKPDFFTHTVVSSEGEITHLSICCVEDFMEKLEGELYKEMVPKKTCVHLSPSIYLQRKGGGSADHAPNDIQIKWKQGTIVKDLFTELI